MKIHELKSPKGSRKRRKIVGRGRGSGHGKTSCRGENGQKSRSTGRAVVLSSEGGQIPLIRRLPKVGFRSKRPVLNQVVNIQRLGHFKEGTVIDAEFLKKNKLISSLNKPVKILAKGDLKKSLVIRLESISRAAREKITKAGGKIEKIVKNSEQKPVKDKLK